MKDLAAEQLLEHADALRALARRLVGPDTADDVVQDTFAAALRSPPDPDRPARPWLGRVLRNVAKMRYRSDSRRVRREDAVAVEPVTATSPAQIVERLEIHRALCAFLVALDEPYRTTIVLHYYDGLSLAEIARKDGVPEATVRWRHKQALDRLRARLDDQSRGDRRAWVAALAPLAGPARPAVLGGLLVKKVALAIVIVIIALVVIALPMSRGTGTPTSSAASPRAVKIQFGQSKEPRLPGADAAPVADQAFGATSTTQIVGRVVDEQARPFAKAVIWLGEGTRKATRAATSGDDGRFAIVGLRPGRFEVVASAGDLVAASQSVALALGKTRELEFVVRTGRVELEGQVIDEAGRGVPNAAIDIRGAVARTVRTDSDGRFRVAGIVAGVYEIAASADDYVRARVSKVVPHEGKADVTLRVGRGVVVTGVVRTANGEPVAGAAVGSTAWNLDDPRLDVESDAHGVFRIGPLPSGSTRLSAFHPAHGVSEIVTLELPPESAPSIDLVFRSSAAIEGVVRLDNGTPAAGAAITVTASDTPARWSVDTDESGRFALTSLPVGAYTIEATARADLPPQTAAVAHTTVTLTRASREHVSLEIASSNEHVRGHVVDERGAPVTGAAVWAERAGLAMSPMSLDNVRTYSGNDGAFDLADLARGAYTIYAAVPGRSSGRLTDVRAGASSITIALAASASVAGRAITRDGKPIRSFHLQWKWISRSGEHGEVMSSAGRMIEDADGPFAIDGLDPTRMFAVTIETATGATGDLAPFALAAGERKAYVEVIAEGAGTVRGRLIDRSTGKPAIGLVVFFPALAARSQVPVDGNGRFEAQVPAGPYRNFNIQDETQGYPDVERAFTVKAGDTTELGDVMVDLR